MRRRSRLLVLFCVLLSACGSMQVPVTPTLRAVDAALVRMDEAAASAYRLAADLALESSDTREEYDTALRPWTQLSSRLKEAKSALKSVWANPQLAGTKIAQNRTLYALGHLRMAVELLRPDLSVVHYQSYLSRISDIYRSLEGQP